MIFRSFAQSDVYIYIIAEFRIPYRRCFRQENYKLGQIGDIFHSNKPMFNDFSKLKYCRQHHILHIAETLFSKSFSWDSGTLRIKFQQYENCASVCNIYVLWYQRTLQDFSKKQIQIMKWNFLMLSLQFVIILHQIFADSKNSDAL